MIDQDMEIIDIENKIPSNNIIVNKDHCQLKVVKQRQDTQGFLETNIELIQLPKQISNGSSSSSSSNNQIITRVLCLSIDDLKNYCTYKTERDCWEFNNVLFKCVLLYGRVTVKSESTKNNRAFYTVNIDDETESIDGFINKSTQQETSKNKQSMTIKRNELERRKKETGINLRGNFYSTDSQECQLFLSNLKNLQEMIQKNLNMKEKRFPLGTLKENCLIYAFPYQSNNDDSIRLSIIDLIQCDSLELSWKRNLNKSSL